MKTYKFVYTVLVKKTCTVEADNIDVAQEIADSEGVWDCEQDIIKEEAFEGDSHIIISDKIKGYYKDADAHAIAFDEL